MKVFGLSIGELIELWPFGLEFGRSLKRLIDARAKKGFTSFQSVRDTLIEATERVDAKTVDVPEAPTAAEQGQFDWTTRRSGGM